MFYTEPVFMENTNKNTQFCLCGTVCLFTKTANKFTGRPKYKIFFCKDYYSIALRFSFIKFIFTFI